MSVDQLHDLDLERYTIHGALEGGAPFIKESKLEPSDFYSEANGTIWSVLRHMADEGETIDDIALHNHLAEVRGLLQRVGGAEYLNQLTTGIPASVQDTVRLRVLARRRAVREHVRRANEILAAGGDASAELQALDQARAQLAELETGEKRGPLDGVWKTVGEWGMLDADPPPQKWLLQRPNDETCGMGAPVGVLPLGEVGMFIGAGGMRKTYTMIQLGVAVATGRKWLDYFTVATPGRVLLALGEERQEQVWRRLHAVAHAMRLTDFQRRQVAENVTVLPLAGHLSALVESDGRTTAQTEFMLALRRRLSEREWSLAILDPLARFGAGDTEKDNAQATRFIQVVESLAQSPGSPSVLVVHHTNKLSRADGTKASVSDGRGVSAITDGARWAANLERSADDTAVLKITKHNNAPDCPPLQLVADANYGGCLRVATPEEARQRTEAKQAAKEEEDAERIAPVAEKVVRWLADHPDQSKEPTAKSLRLRPQDVSKAFDLLERQGRVEKTSRYGYSAVGCT